MAKEKKGVRLEHISKIYQDPKTKKNFYAVKDTSLDIEPGSFVTLLGPSGCGKTTTLRMIAGFESPDEGEIYLGGEPINALTPNKRDTAMVFQSYALLPHYNIFDNVAYGLKLRVSMRTEIRRIQQEAGITAIYVTHDQSEAMAISDKIIIMEKGIVAQMGSPQEIYYHPKSEFVADFIGEANFLKGPLKSKNGSDGVVDISGTKVDVKEISNFGVGDTCTLVLRPESAVLADSGQLPCRVILSCFMGSYQNYHVMVGDNLVKITDFNPKNKKIYNVGDKAYVKFDPANVHVL